MQQADILQLLNDAANPQTSQDEADTICQEFIRASLKAHPSQNPGPMISQMFEQTWNKRRHKMPELFLALVALCRPLGEPIQFDLIDHPLPVPQLT